MLRKREKKEESLVVNPSRGKDKLFYFSVFNSGFFKSSPSFLALFVGTEPHYYIINVAI